VSKRIALVGQHGATRSSRQARLARHVFRGVAKAWTGMGMSTPLFPEVAPEIYANPEQKRLNLYTRALLLLRRPPGWNKYGWTRSSRRMRRVVSRPDVTSQVECGLYGAAAIPWQWRPPLTGGGHSQLRWRCFSPDWHFVQSDHAHHSPFTTTRTVCTCSAEQRSAHF